MNHHYQQNRKKLFVIKIKQLIYDHCVVLHQNDQSTTTVETNTIVLNDEPVIPVTTITTTRLTPKRKRLFSNIEQKDNKETKIDMFGFIEDEILNYITHEDDSDRFILINQSSKFKALSRLVTKVLTVPATSSPIERIFSQSGFLFRQHRSKMSREPLQILTMLKCNHGL